MLLGQFAEEEMDSVTWFGHIDVALCTAYTLDNLGYDGTHFPKGKSAGGGPLTSQGFLNLQKHPSVASIRSQSHAPTATAVGLTHQNGPAGGHVSHFLLGHRCDPVKHASFSSS